MPITNVFGNLVVELLRSSTRYLALHATDPGVSGSPASEIAGNGYTRQIITFSAGANRSTANSAAITFLNLPQTAITAFGIWDAQVSGNCLAVIYLATPLAALSGQFLTIPVNDVALTFN